MSSRGKGNASELKCQKFLEAEGFLVQRAGYRRFQQNDFFNLFDVMAIKPGITLFVQVKTNAKPGRKVFQDIADFMQKYPQFDAEIWIWCEKRRTGRTGWRKFQFN